MARLCTFLSVLSSSLLPSLNASHAAMQWFLPPSPDQNFLVTHHCAGVPLVEAEMSRFASRITSVERKHGVTNGVEWHHGNGHNFVVTCISRA